MPNNEINMDVQGQGSASVSMNPSVDDAAFVGRAEAWAVGKRNGTDVPSTDPTYHNNAKYYAADAAASAADAQQYTAAAVHTWLENNVDPETGYVLDRTLSEKLAAAPADMVGDLKSAFEALAYGETITPTLVWSNGQIKASDGTIGTANTYKHTDLIPVKPGMNYSVSSRSSDSFFILGMYATELSNADTTLSIAGHDTQEGTLETATGKIPDGINFVRVGCATTDYESASITLTSANLPDVIEDVEEIQSELFGAYQMPDLGWQNGYVRYSDGAIVSHTQYRYSVMMPVNEGMIIHVNTTASTSVMAVAMYKNTTDNTAVIIKSVKGFADSGATIFDGIIPKGIKGIRFSCLASYISSFAATIEIPSYDNRIDENSTNLKNKTSAPYIYARRAVIGFIMDKDYQYNRAMRNVFVEHNAPFGVALSYNSDTFANTSLSEYLYWEKNNNFEMLTHGSYALPTTETYTDEQVIGFINDSYDTLVSYGFDPKGYIAGAGLMADHYIPFVQNKYDWAATRANHYGTDESCIIFGTDAPYKLWRYSLQTSTLAEMKAAVDRAIANNYLLLFYGHAQSGQLQNFTEENLDALLDYIESKDAVIMKPTEAVESYYSLRYDDFYPNN